MVRLERKAGASFRMDSQDQLEAGGVWLERKIRVSVRVELQGQEDAKARVASGALCRQRRQYSQVARIT